MKELPKSPIRACGPRLVVMVEPAKQLSDIIYIPDEGSYDQVPSS